MGIVEFSEADLVAALAREERITNASRRRGLTPHDILARVSIETGFPVETLLGRSRFRTVAAARARLFQELRATGLSYPEIGRFCGRDHTTVMSALRHWEAS
jgi:chromosomal replication initiation ATPase DnaA